MLLRRRRAVYSESAFAGPVRWQLPQPMARAAHACQYRLACVVRGRWVMRFDNEAGKGDHRHLAGAESSYRFTTVERLVEDFRDQIGRGIVKTVTLEVRSPSDVMADFAHAWESGHAPRDARIAFATPELLWKVLTAKRWGLLKALCGAGPVSIRDAARRVGRDVKAVHSDVTALLSAGVLNRTDDGRVEFPYEAVKVEFLLQAA